MFWTDNSEDFLEKLNNESIELELLVVDYKLYIHYTLQIINYQFLVQELFHNRTRSWILSNRLNQSSGSSRANRLVGKNKPLILLVLFLVFLERSISAWNRETLELNWIQFNFVENLI